MTTLREELAEIIRWRFRSADGKPLNGPSVVQRAMEIADELAPFIEDAVGWDDAAVPAPEREAVRVLEEVRQEWDSWRQTLPEGAFTDSDGLRFVRVLEAKLAALRAEGSS